MARLLHRPANAQGLIYRILDQPQLVAQVQALEPRVLTRLIHHVGLEDAGELIALATTEQLERVFDEDLWRSEQPGQDDLFDAQRFLVWLEVLVEQGAGFAAERLAELDPDLVTLALCKHVLVIDLDQLALQMGADERSDDDEQLDKALEGSLHLELEQYRIIARTYEGFDAISSVLIELNSHDYTTLTRLLERCCAISMEQIEDNGGLYEVLTSEQQVEADVAGDREDRRERQGYVSPSSALSFLKLAIASEVETMLAEREPDPITRAHFRASPLVKRETPNAPERPTSLALAPTRNAEQLSEVLRQAEVLREEEQPKALPASKSERSLLREAMSVLARERPELAETRGLELLYLSNVLLAGLGTREQRLRPLQAAEGAICVAELGAERMLGFPNKRGRTEIDELSRKLRRTTLVTLFRVGFHLVCEAEARPSVEGHALLSELRGLARRQGLCGV